MNPNELAALEQLLRERSAALEQVQKDRHAFSPEAFAALRAEVLDLERQLCRAHGRPFADEMPTPLWEGFPLGVAVIGGQLECVFIVETRGRVQTFKSIAFHGVRGYRLEAISDETIEGHPLWRHGLQPYRAFVVENSNWVQALAENERLALGFSDQTKVPTVHHYLLMLKDRTFEALAKSLEVVGDDPTREAALRRAVATVFDGA